MRSALAEDLIYADPGLLGAVLIALACGWLARRLLLRGPGVFACLALGAAGALLGLAAMEALSLPVRGAGGLAATALGGSVFIQALGVLAGRFRREP